jgi:hypothetical protein
VKMLRLVQLCECFARLLIIDHSSTASLVPFDVLPRLLVGILLLFL